MLARPLEDEHTGGATLWLAKQTPWNPPGPRSFGSEVISSALLSRERCVQRWAAAYFNKPPLIVSTSRLGQPQHEDHRTIAGREQVSSRWIEVEGKGSIRRAEWDDFPCSRLFGVPQTDRAISPG